MWVSSLVASLEATGCTVEEMMIERAKKQTLRVEIETTRTADPRS